MVSSCVHSNVEGFDKPSAGSLFNQHILLLKCFRKFRNFLVNCLGNLSKCLVLPVVNWYSLKWVV